MKHFILYTVILIALISCNSVADIEYLPTIQPKILQSKGGEIELDTFKNAEIVELKNVTPIKLKNPSIIPSGIEFNTLSAPTVKSVKISSQQTSGTDTFLVPEQYEFAKTKQDAGVPERILVGSPKVSQIKSKNLTFYGEETGLEPGTFWDVTFDNKEVLWLISAHASLVRFDGLHYTVWKPQHGLYDGTYYLYFDAEREWVITFGKKGVQIFDGKQFTSFPIEFDIGRPVAVIKKSNNSVWLIGKQGVLDFDYLNNKAFFYGKDQGLKGRIIRAKQNSEGHLWLLTENGITHFKSISSENEPGVEFIDYGMDQFVISSDQKKPNFSIIHVDAENNLWVGNDYALQRIKFVRSSADGELELRAFDLRKDIKPPHDVKWHPHSLVKGMGDDGAGNLYVYIARIGTVVFNFRNNYSIENLVGENGLGAWNKFICKDKNTLWALTSKGIAKIESNPFESILDRGKRIRAYKFTEDPFGCIWLGTYGRGIFKYVPNEENPSQWHCERYTKKLHDISSDYIDDFHQDSRDGSIWVGTRTNGMGKMEFLPDSSVNYIKYTYDNGLPVSCVPMIDQDSKGNIWFTTFNFGTAPAARLCMLNDNTLTRYGNEQGFFNRADGWVIKVDEKDNIWYSHHYFLGLAHFKTPKVDVAQSQLFSIGRKNGINSTLCRDIIKDRHDNIWIALEDGGGLVQIETIEGEYKVSSYTMKEGLPSNSVVALLEDFDGHIWIGGHKGLTKMENVVGEDGSITRTFINYNERDGLPPVRFYIGGMFQSSDSSIWFGNNRGSSKLNPNELGKSYKTISAEINNVQLFNEDITWVKDETQKLNNGVIIKDLNFDSLKSWTNIPVGLRLKHTENQIGFNFTANSISNPEKVTFSYKMDGLEIPWSTPTSKTIASFAGLSAGKYTFHLKARMGTDAWGPMSSYSFKIRPPWWKSAVAYICYALLGIFLLGYYLRSRIALATWRMRQVEDMRTKISADLHDDIGTLLTGIAMQSEYLAKQKPTNLDDELLEIGTLSRTAMEKLRDVVWSLDPRKDRFENLIDRMRNYAGRQLTNSKFKYDFSIKEIEGSEFINPEVRRNVYLIFKEAITNILKHSTGDEVKIDFIKRDAQYFLSIFDNGYFVQSSKTDGLGLSNMKMRAKKIQGELKISRERGFRIELGIPIVT